MITFSSWIKKQKLIRETYHRLQQLLREVRLLLESEEIDSLAILLEKVKPFVKEEIKKLLLAGKFTSPESISEAENIVNGTEVIDLGGMLKNFASKAAKSRGMGGLDVEEIMSDTLSRLWQHVFMKVQMAESWESVFGDNTIKQVLFAGGKLRTTHSVHSLGVNVADQAKRIRGDVPRATTRQLSQIGDEERGYDPEARSEESPEESSIADSFKQKIYDLIDKAIANAIKKGGEEVIDCLKSPPKCSRAGSQKVRRINYMRLAKLVVELSDPSSGKDTTSEAIAEIYANYPEWQEYLTKWIHPTGGKSHKSEMRQFIRYVTKLANPEMVLPKGGTKKFDWFGEYHEGTEHLDFSWFDDLVYE